MSRPSSHGIQVSPSQFIPKTVFLCRPIKAIFETVFLTAAFELQIFVTKNSKKSPGG